MNQKRSRWLVGVFSFLSIVAAVWMVAGLPLVGVTRRVPTPNRDPGSTEPIEQQDLPAPKAPEARRDHEGFTLPEKYFIAAYQTATGEIRDRISHEIVLFSLKFTIVGGILGVLFALSAASRRESKRTAERGRDRGEQRSEDDIDPESGEFEVFLHRRRAVLFFAAATLACTIVDIRLRFNTMLIQQLGSWIRSREQDVVAIAQSLQDGRSSSVPFTTLSWGWEHFFEAAPSWLWNMLGSFSLSLTALLYGVLLYLFVYVPVRAYRSTLLSVAVSAFVMFVLLTLVHISYVRTSWVTFVLAVSGFALLCCSIAIKIKTTSIARLLEDYEHLYEKTDPGRAERISRARTGGSNLPAGLKEEYDEALWWLFFHERIRFRRRLADEVETA